MNLNYNHLYYFHWVAEAGSLTAAAKKLRVVPSTVSEQVRRLEEMLGQKLFDRKGQSLELTDEGRVVLEHTHVMVGAVEKIKRHFNGDDNEVPSVLRIGQCASLSRSKTTAELLPVLMLEDVRPHLETAGHEVLMRRLLRGKIDLVLTDREPSMMGSESVHCRALQGSALVVIAHAEIADAIDEIRDLGDYGILHYGLGSRYRWGVEKFLRDNNISPRVLGEVDDVSLLVAAARAKLGFVVVPRAVLNQDDAELKELFELGDGEWSRYAVFRSDAKDELVARAVEALASSTE